MQNRKKEIISIVLLFITAFCLGTSFVARKLGLLYVTPLLFNSLRFFLGAFFIAIIYYVFQKSKLSRKLEIESEKPLPMTQQIKGGIYMGMFLSMGAILQQLALVSGNVGKVAFFTALYTIMIPIISAVFLRKKTRRNIWIAALIVVAGIYLISGATDFAMTSSDMLALLAALAFAVHILAIEKYSPSSNGLFLSLVQTLTAGVINLTLALIFESGNSFTGIANAFWPLLIAALIAIALPYPLQIIALKNTTATMSSIIVSLESVFGAMLGALILKERMTFIQIIGSALIFAAIVLAQIQPKSQSTEKEKS